MSNRNPLDYSINKPLVTSFNPFRYLFKGHNTGTSPYRRPCLWLGNVVQLKWSILFDGNASVDLCICRLNNDDLHFSFKT